MNMTRNSDNILPFQAVEFHNLAKKLLSEGHDIISLGIGEPDYTAPALVLDALHEAANSGKSTYCPTLGIPALRQKIAEYYRSLSADVSAEQVIVTTGASGALGLVTNSLLDCDDEVLLPEPYYPANYNFIVAAHAKPVIFQTSADNGFQPTLEQIKKHWTPKSRMVLLASPNNPSGTCIDNKELDAIHQWVKSQGGLVVLDEIYVSLSYDSQPKSGLSIDKDLIVINSFSKYFCMTGWRLGWIVAPEPLIKVFERVSASLNICAPTLSQHAALGCFEPESIEIFEKRRQTFKERRDYLLPELQRLGFGIRIKPQGAFYIFADISKFGLSSVEFATRLLNEHGVAITPGQDFGPTLGNTMVRFSYATDLDDIKRAVKRIERFVNDLKHNQPNRVKKA